MDVGALRASVREIQFAVHGVPAIVTIPDGDPVETRIIWLTPVPTGIPDGQTFQREEPKRAMAIRRDDVPAVPMGTIIEVTEHNLESPISWSVDSMDRIEPDHFRVLVVPEEIS